MTTERDKKEDKAMNTIRKTRRAHELLDRLYSLTALSKEQEELLRSFLPEMPKQKTLEDITAHVYNAWLAAEGHEFNGNEYDPDVTIEDWLIELLIHLQGLKDMPVAAPALPAGMRLADHKEYGRVVVSPGKNIHGCYSAFHLDNWNLSEAAYHHVSPDTLTFIDSEPAHPEFLETEADYAAAPEGTIVAGVDSIPRHKDESTWLSVAYIGAKDNKTMAAESRRVLRWGWGE